MGFCTGFIYEIYLPIHEAYTKGYYRSTCHKFFPLAFTRLYFNIYYNEPARLFFITCSLIELPSEE